MKKFSRNYLKLIPRIVIIYVREIMALFFDSLVSFKNAVVHRMFWGRGSLYKSSFHVFIAAITITVLLSGISVKLRSISVNASVESQLQNLVISELGSQGNNLTSVVPINSNQVNYTVREYVIAEGDSLQGIADKYGVSKDTVKWSNNKILSPFNDNAPVGATLKIPEINGVLYQATDKDTLDSIASLTSGDKSTIIDINDLEGPNYNLASTLVFVPNGKLPPPPPQLIARSRPTSSGYIASSRSGAALGSLPAGTFDNPLSHPQCAGYRFSRGISSYHSGVDLSKGGGCPIRAIGAGRVLKAGWQRDGAGYAVTIDHGSGIQSLYYHGDGNIWVKPGDYVQKGQDIMYMGNTGNSFGTHLHLTLKFNGNIIDPQPYVPYSTRR